MTTQQRWLYVFYALVAVAALIATWGQNLAYFGGAGSPGLAFLLDAKANPASRSITVDIGFFFLAAAAFMVFEARRLGVRFVWVYIVAGFLIAISVAFPLFMIAREARLAPAAKPDTPWSLTAGDLIGLAAVTVILLGLTWFVLN